MAVVHFGRREIRARVVYFGPPGSGKAANLEALQDMLPMARRGAAVDAAPDTERGVRYVRLPVLADDHEGWAVRYLAVSSPGQAVFPSTRRGILAGLDGVVFVADASAARLASNVASWRELRDHLKLLDLAESQVPVVVQVNRADVEDALPPEALVAALGCEGRPVTEARARDHVGVLETWEVIESAVRAGWAR